MTKFIYKDMTDGDYINEPLLLIEANLATGKNDNKFTRLSFVTKNGEKISATKWNTPNGLDVISNEVYDVTGRCQLYNGSLSVIINDISPSLVTKDEYPRDCPKTIKELKEQFLQLYNSIEQVALKQLIEFTITKLEKYFTAKAAKNIHHAFESGLAYHSLTMAETADSRSKIYTDLNRDLLVTAAILHDAGKIIELDNEGYTKEGILYGHIIIMNDILQEFIYSNPELKEDLIHLKHIILSHHGRLEWGSPVQPATPEAIMFHHIDKIDADMMIAKTELAKIENNHSTERLWAMDNRVLYKLK